MFLSVIKQARTPVHGIVLDVIGTLFSTANLGHAFAACGLNPSQVTDWYGRIWLDGFALTAAHDYRRFADVAANALIAQDARRLGSDEAQAVLAALHTLDPFPDVREGLGRLRAAGVRVMTLTIEATEVTEALFARAGFHGLVDGYLSAETVRRWKPAPEPYRFGVAQLGSPAANVALITGHAWDVHGARQAGLQTGWLIRAQSQRSQSLSQADVMGSDLATVVQSLLDLRQAPA